MLHVALNVLAIIVQSIISMYICTLDIWALIGQGLKGNSVMVTQDSFIASQNLMTLISNDLLLKSTLGIIQREVERGTISSPRVYIAKIYLPDTNMSHSKVWKSNIHIF